MIKLTAAKCPQCGADIEVNPSLEKTICQYCGTTILVEEAVQKLELSGNVKVAGIKNRDDYLDQAKKHFKVGEYFEAKNCLANIIAEDSFDIEAYSELIKNDLELLKADGIDLDITTRNKEYDEVAHKYYDEYKQTYERLLKIDDKNEREKYLKGYLDEIAKYEAKEKEIEERLEKNKKIIERLNEDYEKISEYGFLSDYRKLIQETFHTTKCVDEAIYAYSGDCYDDYSLIDYSRITQDGIIYMNYEKTSNKYKGNSRNMELYWDNVAVPVKDYSEIDERFEEYCSKIDQIIEDSKQKREKTDNKNEKTRKRKLKWYIFTSIISTLLFIVVIACNIIEFLDDGFPALLLLIFFVDSWLLGYIIIPWMESSYGGVSRNKKKKKK